MEDAKTIVNTNDYPFCNGYLYILFERLLACQPGTLRGWRSLRDLYTPSVGAPVGRD
jgi:hypothetical protein